jgi:hypothetical protein
MKRKAEYDEMKKKLVEPFNEKIYEVAVNGEKFIRNNLIDLLSITENHRTSSSSSSSSSSKRHDNDSIGTIFFAVEAHGGTTLNTKEDLAELTKLNEIVKYSDSYFSARENYYFKKTMQFHVKIFNDGLPDRQKVLADEADYTNFTKYVETVKYTASVPYGFYAILDVFDRPKKYISCDHTKTRFSFENLKCPAQRTQMVVDYANEFKKDIYTKSKNNLDNFFEVIRIRLKQLTIRHFQRAIFYVNQRKNIKTISKQIRREENNIKKFHIEIVAGDKVMHQYKQNISYLDKTYSFDTNDDDKDCMKGIYIPLIIDNVGGHDYVSATQTINIIKKDERNEFFSKALLTRLIHADIPEKKRRIERLETLFNYIDECVANNHSSLWQLYLIGYILGLNVSIIDFSCFGYEDETKLTTRADSSRSLPFQISNEKLKDQNLFSPADERNIVSNNHIFSGGYLQKSAKKKHPKNKTKKRKQKNYQ